MTICPVQNNSQWKTVSVGQYASFCPHFFPDRWGLDLLRPGLTALSPCSRLRFAIPNRFLSSHHILPVPSPISSGKSLPFPTPESTCGDYFLSQILPVPLSIGNLSAERRRYPTVPCENPVFFCPVLVDACIPVQDHVLLLLVSRPSLFPKARPILSTIFLFVSLPSSIFLFSFLLLYHIFANFGISSYGDKKLWYLKKSISGNKHIIDRNSPTLIFAVMHWLSELVRYNPAKFDKYMRSKQNWLLHEFIEKALHQFIDEISCEITHQDIMSTGFRC